MHKKIFVDDFWTNEFVKGIIFFTVRPRRYCALDIRPHQRSPDIIGVYPGLASGGLADPEVASETDGTLSLPSLVYYLMNSSSACRIVVYFKLKNNIISSARTFSFGFHCLCHTR